jgi:hypothetical protein
MSGAGEHCPGAKSYRHQKSFGLLDVVVIAYMSPLELKRSMTTGTGTACRQEHRKGTGNAPFSIAGEHIVLCQIPFELP